MTRADDVEAQVLAALEERTDRGNGWISLPSVDPFVDLPNMMRALEKAGCLEGATFQLTPAGDIGGWWDVLIVLEEEVEP